jgi:peptide/nickel transport system permease protein
VYYALWPGMLILITVLSFNYIGDALRDAFDPRSLER